MAYTPKPSWIRIRPPVGDTYKAIKSTLRQHNLHTVCEEAKCPNLSECWTGGTATLMLLGDTCTRGCRFCAVTSGNPKGLIDPHEPSKAAQTVALMNLDYVVLTMVDRDDLADGGVAHVALTIAKIRERCPHTLIEALVGDFRGQTHLLDQLLCAEATVLAHNLETVERLSPSVRDRKASYRQSLDVLRYFKERVPTQFTKSSIMLGLGETQEEVLTAMADLREVGVDFLTLGQYLQPTPKHLAVQRFVTPEEFESFEDAARHMGFRYTASGPLVRSSYRAGEFYIRSIVESASQVSLPVASASPA